ncbi:MAG: tRNA pseudouridine(55) synthase TruB, partial [Nitrososphaerales archaeon]
MDGILNIDKPQGWTSHDVVAWIRRVLKVKRVGHAGTLDPLATGVLLVCVGQATRVSEYLMASDKTYRAQIQLGTITDTYDTDGEVIESRPLPPEIDRGAIWVALGRFVGDIMQAPPAYSAIKQDGVPLHRRVRRGEDVRPAARPVHIHSIQLVDWAAPCLIVDVTCDPGTYIRSLAHDLGQTLGCGAALSGLRRTRSGHFLVEDAISPDGVAEAYRAGNLARYLHPVNAALSQLTPVAVSEDEAKRLRHGQPITGHAPAHARSGYAL